MNDLQRNKSNWLSNVKLLLNNYGFGYIWENLTTCDVNAFIPYFKQRLVDCFTQEWRHSLDNNGVLTVYKHIKTSLEYECYLSSIRNKVYRYNITKIRLSAHKLRIETGRYGQNRIERHERICEICKSSDIEDEFHFVIVCPKYKWIRQRYIPRYYYVRPSMAKFLELVSVTNIDVLNKLACYINCALKIRSNEMQ